jgi:hypothetical protein
MAQPARNANNSEQSLSGALIGGAFGFIGLAIFASASYADKVDPPWLKWGNFGATIAVILLIVSVFFGGRGSTGKVSAGKLNPFNIQAITGLVGIALLAISAAVFAFNPKQEQAKPDPIQVNIRLNRLEQELARQHRMLLLVSKKQDDIIAAASKESSRELHSKLCESHSK